MGRDLTSNINEETNFSKDFFHRATLILMRLQKKKTACKLLTEENKRWKFAIHKGKCYKRFSVA